MTIGEGVAAECEHHSPLWDAPSASAGWSLKQEATPKESDAPTGHVDSQQAADREADHEVEGSMGMVSFLEPSRLVRLPYLGISSKIFMRAACILIAAEHARSVAPFRPADLRMAETKGSARMSSRT